MADDSWTPAEFDCPLGGRLAADRAAELPENDLMECMDNDVALIVEAVSPCLGCIALPLAVPAAGREGGNAVTEGRPPPAEYAP